MTQRANSSKLVSSLGKIITYARSRTPATQASPEANGPLLKPVLSRKSQKKLNLTPSSASQGFAGFLKQTRATRYRSAREFYAQIGETGREQLGVSYAQYSRYESGQGLPPLEWMQAWVSFFEVPLETAVQTWMLAQLSRLPADTATKLSKSLEAAFAPPVIIKGSDRFGLR